MKVFKSVTSHCLVFVMLFVYYLATPVKALAESAERAEAIETYADATNDFSANTELEYSPLVGEEEANREEFIKVFRRQMARGKPWYIHSPFTICETANGKQSIIRSNL